MNGKLKSLLSRRANPRQRYFNRVNINIKGGSLALLVKDRMIKNVAIVSPDDPMSRVVKTMAERNIGCVVVCDGRKVCGIITERDIVRKVAAPDKDTRSMKAKDAMSCRIIGLDTEKSVQEAAEILRKNGIKKLPVMKKGNLVGIVTMTDLLRSMQEIEKENSAKLKKTIKDLDLAKIRLQTRIIELEDRLVSKG
jgi:CBS domain-containing protein